ncbi:MAG TPA: hypothetical protein PKV98_18920 [Burkholderiaceae bacterium]|nr:hypothetical protein [Burkholderiaceae bacterium]
MSAPRECFVIQRKAGRNKEGKDVWADWVNPMNQQVEYVAHEHAVRALIRRANEIDYRIVRRITETRDEPVGIFR